MIWISLTGLSPYAKVHELQKRLVEKRIAGVGSDLGDRAALGDVMIALEHPPTVTRGRGLQRSVGEASVVHRHSGGETNDHVHRHSGGAETGGYDQPHGAPSSLPRQMPLVGELQSGTEYFEIERGGDLTWHGPGQLVVYPIVLLSRDCGDTSQVRPAPVDWISHQDIGKFLRGFEARFIDLLATYGLSASSRENATGVWVSDLRTIATPDDSAQRKIASLGIAIKKWVTYHGIAINVVNELAGFNQISPCGFSPNIMTRLVDLVDSSSAAKLREPQWRDEFEARLRACLGLSHVEVISGTIDEIRERFL